VAGRLRPHHPVRKGITSSSPEMHRDNFESAAPSGLAEVHSRLTRGAISLRMDVILERLVKSICLNLSQTGLPTESPYWNTCHYRYS
jgi:hypothetical protein